MLLFFLKFKSIFVIFFLVFRCLDIVEFVVELTMQLDEGKGMAKTVADVKDANKRTALHFAAREGRIEVCKFLVEELKLDVNVKDEDGIVLNLISI